MASSNDTFMKDEHSKEKSVQPVPEDSQTRTADAGQPPEYEDNDLLPSYSEVFPRQLAVQRPQPQPRPQSHLGSCGMPASVVQGVLAGGSSTKRPAHSKAKATFAQGNDVPRELKTSSAHWNVQGVRLSDFGNPFRRGHGK